jgi:hypothetical protein
VRRKKFFSLPPHTQQIKAKRVFKKVFLPCFKAHYKLQWKKLFMFIAAAKVKISFMNTECFLSRFMWSECQLFLKPASTPKFKESIRFDCFQRCSFQFQKLFTEIHKRLFYCLFKTNQSCGMCVQKAHISFNCNFL